MKYVSSINLFLPSFNTRRTTATVGTLMSESVAVGRCSCMVSLHWRRHSLRCCLQMSTWFAWWLMLGIPTSHTFI